jgi:acyl-CoA thioesterase
MDTDKDILAKKVVGHMMEHDLFSQWLGIEVLEVKEGYSKIKMTVRKEMINGFGIVHGGIAFSLADSAFAFACNNRNVLSVALDTSINFLKPVHVDDVLTAEASEQHNGKSTGLYHINITNQNNHLVALFKGLCYRTDRGLIGGKNEKL